MSALLDKLAPPAPPASGPDWLEALRREARRGLMQHGFPTLKTEDWKYTSLRLLEQRELAPPTAVPGAETRPLPPVSGTTLAWIDGRFDLPAERPPGLAIVDLVTSGDAAARALLELPLGGAEDAFARLNTERLESAWLIDVREDLARPLVLLFAHGDGFRSAVHPRIVLRVAAGARAEVLEWHTGGGAGLANIVITTELGAGATLDHWRLQDTGDDAALVQRHDVTVMSDAGYTWSSLDVGGRWVRSDLNVALAAPGARVRLGGGVAISGRRHVDHHTRIDHRVGHTRSEEDFRTVLSGQARAVFNGRIHMQPGADDSESALNSANLLLSPDARIDAKPELEIHAEEVKASHGATVGALDEDALFYLRSRGLPGDEATQLLKSAFLSPLLDGIARESVRDAFAKRLNEVLES